MITEEVERPARLNVLLGAMHVTVISAILSREPCYRSMVITRKYQIAMYFIGKDQNIFL